MANEYILKDKVLNLIEHNDRVCHYADERYENVVYATTQTICKVVANMPAADVQPVKHGRWLSRCEGDIYEFSECSECGNMESCETPYCAQCGARMDGET